MPFHELLYLRELLFDSLFHFGTEERGIKNHPEQCFRNDCSPSVHGRAVEVEPGGGGTDQVQHLVIIMILMVVKMVNKCVTFIFISNY